MEVSALDVQASGYDPRNSLHGEGIEEGHREKSSKGICWKDQEEGLLTKAPWGLEIGRVGLTLTWAQPTVPPVYLGWGDNRSGLGG